MEVDSYQNKPDDIQWRRDDGDGIVVIQSLAEVTVTAMKVAGAVASMKLLTVLLSMATTQIQLTFLPLRFPYRSAETPKPSDH